MNSNNKISVGTNHWGYPEIRNYAGLAYKNFVVKKTYDICKLSEHIYFKLLNRNHKFLHNFHTNWEISKKIKLYHFFNTISSTSKPWIVTFESVLPMYNPKSLNGIKLLAGNKCKKIIAFCQNTYNIQKNNLVTFPDYADKILEKTIIIHPSQHLHLSSVDDKNYSDDIIFTFIGGDFFRKGGAEILQISEKLIIEGFQIKLNIISQLKYGSWKDQHITATDVDNAKTIINKYPKHINHYTYLPNNKVIELLKISHIGLLPSYGETYGYSVLEAQACGCPVITTNIPPFDEINNYSIGWLIDVPLIERGGSFTSDVYSYDERIRFSNTLKQNLYKIMKNILSNTSQITTKATNAINHIKNKHNPLKTTKKIEEIYTKALTN